MSARRLELKETCRNCGRFIPNNAYRTTSPSCPQCRFAKR